MPYKPTGRPNGRPRKNSLPPAPEPQRRVRREFAPPPSRAFVSAVAPEPFKEPADTSPPLIGQRKRVKQRRPCLIPAPLKA
jgi:hypothetical protein